MNAGRAAAFVIPLSLAASLALAEDPQPPEKKPAASREAPAPPAAPAKGLVVFVDPVTGQIRQPDPAEIGALTAPPQRSTTARPAPDAPLLMKYGPGGAVGVVLDSRYESFMVVTKKPDGSLSMDCVEGARKADEAVTGGTKKKPAKTATGPEASDAR
jgi:hypothetical protein